MTPSTYYRISDPPMTSSAELRKLFLDYFRDHGHEVIASSSLAPINDSTLLFTCCLLYTSRCV